MKTALVTGATGFVGGHLVRHLLSGGYKVNALVRNPDKILPQKNLTIIKGDITNSFDVLTATEGADVVFHLAGYIAYTPSDRPSMEKINVKGTQNVVDACITHKTPKLIHMSSVVAIGASFDGKPLNEDSKYNVGHLNLGYFETKNKAEKLVVEAVIGQNLNASIINPSTIYGAGDAKKGSRQTQVKVAQGKFPFYPPGGVNVVHINDIIFCLLAAVEKGQPGRRYLVIGENMLIKDLFDKIANCTGKKPPKISLPKSVIHGLGFASKFLSPLGLKLPVNPETAWTSTLYHWFTSERAELELGLKPTPSDQAIEESVRWMQDNGFLEQS